MSALAVYFEREGIATVVVGLVRLHLQKIRPPRALWVPFEMGRPLGAYTQRGEFQKKVLRAAFQLLERNDGPVILEDFTGEDPGATADPSWLMPDLAGAQTAVDEVRMLQPRWEAARARLGRTMVGLSGLAIEQATEYLERYDTDSPLANPADDMSDLLRMRFCADDVRAYYAEAALAEGDPDSAQIGDWFWGKSRAAAALRRIRAQNISHENRVKATVCGKMMVPGARVT